MKSMLCLLSVLCLPTLSFAQGCFSPNDCTTPQCPEGQVWESCEGPVFGPTNCTPRCVVQSTVSGPQTLCIGNNPCQVVNYHWLGNIVIAQSTLANGYALMGWSGPCLHTDRNQCPDILNQAFTDLKTNALRINRGQTFIQP